MGYVGPENEDRFDKSSVFSAGAYAHRIPVQAVGLAGYLSRKFGPRNWQLASYALASSIVCPYRSTSRPSKMWKRGFLTSSRNLRWYSPMRTVTPQ